MVSKIIATTCGVGHAPVSCVNTDCAPSPVHHCVYAQARLDYPRNFCTFFMHRIALQEGSINAGPSSTSFKVEGEHMRGLDGSCRSESGADGFATAGKAREVV